MPFPSLNIDFVLIHGVHILFVPFVLPVIQGIRCGSRHPARLQKAATSHEVVVKALSTWTWDLAATKLLLDLTRVNRVA
jgi:hypothetical protein